MRSPRWRVHPRRRRGPEQHLEARHALRGGHEPGLDARFSHARLRVQHLEDWAQLDGLAQHFSSTDDGLSFDGTSTRITYEKPTVEPAEIPDGWVPCAWSTTSKSTSPPCAARH